MTSINQHIIKSLLNARNQLSSDANDLICSFLKSQIYSKGGFIDRSGKADPYYSVFGYSLCYVYNIHVDIKNNLNFLNNWKQNNEVDFVHAISLIRCFYLIKVIRISQKFKRIFNSLSNNIAIQNFIASIIARKIRKKHKDLLQLITQYRLARNGFNHLEQNSKTASVYSNFLAYGLLQDLNFPKYWQNDIAESCIPMELNDGSFVNNANSESGICSTTAAGIILLNQHNFSVTRSIAWLKGLIGPSGGFFAGQNVPVCDLLSTSTALFALNLVKESDNKINQNAADFINMHWHNSGGFFGSIADQMPDIEYTFYALLGIGQLNLNQNSTSD